MEFKSQAIKTFYEKYKDQEEIDSVITFLNKEYSHKSQIMFNYHQAVDKLRKGKIENISVGKVEPIISFDDGYKIVRLLDKEARLYDAKLMKNCLGSYDEHFGLFSLRDENDQPHLNFEIKKKKIKQIMGFGNSKVAPKYIPYVERFYEKMKLELNTAEMERLGYSKNDWLWQQFKDYFGNIQYISIKNVDYIYEGNQLKIVKKIDFKSEYLILYLLRTKQCDDAIIQLVNNGTDIRFSDDFLLKKACIYGRFNLVTLFVNNGADVASGNNSAIRSAAELGYVNIVRYLIRHGADIHVNNNQIKRHAIRDGNEKMIEFLKKGYYRFDQFYSVINWVVGSVKRLLK